MKPWREVSELDKQSECSGTKSESDQSQEANKQYKFINSVAILYWKMFLSIVYVMYALWKKSNYFMYDLC